MEELSSSHSLFGVLLVAAVMCGYMVYLVTRFRTALQNYPRGGG